MTPIQYEIDNAARLDTEILIASRIMEQAESACRSAAHRRDCLVALRLERSIGGSGNWCRGVEGCHVLAPMSKPLHELRARLSLYTGGTQEWTLDLYRLGKKPACMAYAKGSTPRAALLALSPTDAAAARWLEAIVAAALKWDEFNEQQAASLGLLCRAEGL